MTLWRTGLEGRDREHGKKMEGLDILLDFVGNYTEDLGRKREEKEREGKEFDPYLLVEEVERGVEEAQIGAKEGMSLDCGET